MDWNILGHEWAIALLKGHLQHEGPRHAYLFVGPKGIGRRTLALRLAQAVNCPAPPAPGTPCGECRTCRHIERMQHPDLFLIQAEWEGGTLKVEQIRALQSSLALTPYEARYRVALLLRFEEAHPSAANALLKTLEEPNPHVILLLTAENVENLLPTIVSRCEVLRLRPLALETVARWLHERWSLPEEQALLLAHLSNGRPGYAVQLHQNPEQLERHQQWLDQAMALFKSNLVQRFALVESLTSLKDDRPGKMPLLRNALLTWLSLWRDVLLSANSTAVPITNIDRQEKVASLAKQLGATTAQFMLTRVEDTLTLLEKNVNPRLALEVLMLDWPRMAML